MSDIKAGQWYADRISHEFFLVIGFDESDGLVDVRDRYGDIDEFDLDEWDSMNLVLCAAPAAWQPSVEDADDADEHPPR